MRRMQRLLDRIGEGLDDMFTSRAWTWEDEARQMERDRAEMQADREVFHLDLRRRAVR